MEYHVDARLKRSPEQKGKDERGTPVPTTFRIFGEEDGKDSHKMTELKVEGAAPLYFPIEDLQKIVKAEA